MIALIRKELREIVWVPLGFVAFMAAVTGILYLQHWWSNAIVGLYAAGLWLFVMYVGCEAIAGDGTRGTAEWSCRWPVSRLKWWAVKLLMRAVVVGLVSVAARCALAWLLAQHAGDVSHPALNAALGPIGYWSLFGGFLGLALPFSASSVTRTSVQAFGLALVLGLLGGIAYSFPIMVYVFAHRTDMGDPPRYLVVLPGALWVMSMLAASAYTFATLPALEYGRRAKRAVIVLGAVVVPAMVIAIGIPFVSDVFTKPAPKGVSQALVSPDGRQIVFSDHVFAEGFWVVNTDGTGLRRISRERFSGSEFAWLPDSRRILMPQQAMRTGRRTDPRGRSVASSTSTGEMQWSVLDTQTPKSAPQTVYTGGGRLRISPGGKYLMIGGQFIEMDTWRLQGKVEEPNYEPWLLTWLPDDSAIYVREHQERPYREHLKRIAVPSGEVTPPELPNYPDLRQRSAPARPRPLSNRTDWFCEDRSEWVDLPPDKQPLIHSSKPSQGPKGTLVYTPYTYNLSHRKIPKSLVYRADGSRHYLLEGLEPIDNGISPQGRYCLMSVVDGATEHDETTPWYTAFLDMGSGKIVSRVTLPGVMPGDRMSSLNWSPDERYVVMVMAHWGTNQIIRELYFMSVAGEFKQIDPGNMQAFGDPTPVGWTFADELVVLRQERELVAIAPQGQERVILRAHSRYVDEATGGSNGTKPSQPTGGEVNRESPSAQGTARTAAAGPAGLRRDRAGGVAGRSCAPIPSAGLGHEPGVLRGAQHHAGALRGCQRHRSREPRATGLPAVLAAQPARHLGD